MEDEHHGHPKDRGVEPGDPMSLHATRVTGDAGLMLDCLVEEYARLGWGQKEIEALFVRPFFRATHDLQEQFGAGAIRDRIRRVLARCGVLKVTVRRAPVVSDPAAEPTRLLPVIR